VAPNAARIASASPATSSRARYRLLVPARTAITSLRVVAIAVDRKLVTGTIGRGAKPADGGDAAGLAEPVATAGDAPADHPGAADPGADDPGAGTDGWLAAAADRAADPAADSESSPVPRRPGNAAPTAKPTSVMAMAIASSAGVATDGRRFTAGSVPEVAERPSPCAEAP